MARGTVGGGGVDEEAVGLCGAREGGEPPVESREFLGEFGEDWDGFRVEALHDGREEIVGDCEGLFDEAGHGWGIAVGGGAEDLFFDGLVLRMT